MTRFAPTLDEAADRAEEMARALDKIDPHAPVSNVMARRADLLRLLATGAPIIIEDKMMFDVTSDDIEWLMNELFAVQGKLILTWDHTEEENS